MNTPAPVALIVGAGDHIGAAIARRFARGGYTVCLGRRRGEALAPLVADIEAAGGTAHGFSLDARDETQVEARFAWIEDSVGPLSVVVSNVGGNVQFPLRDTTSRVFRKVWEMCTLTGFLVGREAARVMVPRRHGSVFFTGATASVRGSAGYAAFAAGKHGLRALAESMAREFGSEGIHVAHLIIDAGVDTDWVRERIRARGDDPDALPPGSLMNPDSVAETYWQLHHQPRDAWTFEMDLRPAVEHW
ncbi:MAG: SDR family NAD(P)-dependent oxidoreductase [Pseudomonadota bacterium]